ncbi:MAG: S-methyl-5'-thioadenosine phosphorylase [Hyphomicrobiaceae bacterium hypho_1]
MTDTVLGIIGGSGLYDLPAAENSFWEEIVSPWGEPSDCVLFSEIEGLPVRFMPRHGRGHKHAPTNINYRANIDCLKRVGVTDLISISACGSLQKSLVPGTFVLVDQFIDHTYERSKSFFGSGCVAHISIADPVSPIIVDKLEKALQLESINYTRGGTYLTIEGPQFSSRAECQLYRSWGCDVIGMTNMPEAKLAREAEICYATVAMVTDYDCWHDEHADVNVADVVKIMKSNAEKAKRMILAFTKLFPRQHPMCPLGSDRALDTALLTEPEVRDPVVVAKLDAVAGRILKSY